MQRLGLSQGRQAAGCGGRRWVHTIKREALGVAALPTVGRATVNGDVLKSEVVHVRFWQAKKLERRAWFVDC